MSGTTGTPRMQSYLLTNEFQDGQAAGSVTTRNMRDLIVSSLNIVPTVVSAAGTTQGTAAVLSAQSNIVTICAAGAGVVATSGYTKIYSRGANAVLVYPIPDAQWEGLAANAPISVPVGNDVECYMTSTTQGYVG